MANHAGKTPVKKTVTREGKTHEQTFWINPGEAARAARSAHFQGKDAQLQRKLGAHDIAEGHQAAQHAFSRSSEAWQSGKGHRDAADAHRKAAEHFAKSAAKYPGHTELANRHKYQAMDHDDAEARMARTQGQFQKAHAHEGRAQRTMDGVRPAAAHAHERETPASHATRDAKAKQAARGVSARSKAGQELMRKLQAARPQQSHGPLSAYGRAEGLKQDLAASRPGRVQALVDAHAKQRSDRSAHARQLINDLSAKNPKFGAAVREAKPRKTSQTSWAQFDSKPKRGY